MDLKINKNFILPRTSLILKIRHDKSNIISQVFSFYFSFYYISIHQKIENWCGRLMFIARGHTASNAGWDCTRRCLSTDAVRPLGFGLVCSVIWFSRISFSFNVYTLNWEKYVSIESVQHHTCASRIFSVCNAHMKMPAANRKATSTAARIIACKWILFIFGQEHKYSKQQQKV